MKITVYTIAADTARDGSFCHAFATEAERDAWAWENIVAKNLRSDETADGSEECIDLVKDAFPTAYDAIHIGERKGYDDSYWFYENEIEIPDQLPLDTEARQFIATLARCTTPEQEFEQGLYQTKEYDDVEDYVSDMSDERLCEEYSAFMDFVKGAQDLDARLAPAEQPDITVVLEGGMIQSIIGTPIGLKVRSIDYDTDGADEDDLTDIVSTKLGTVDKAVVAEWEVEEAAVAIVEHAQ